MQTDKVDSLRRCRQQYVIVNLTWLPLSRRLRISSLKHRFAPLISELVYRTALVAFECRLRFVLCASLKTPRLFSAARLRDSLARPAYCVRRRECGRLSRLPHSAAARHSRFRARFVGQWHASEAKLASHLAIDAKRRHHVDRLGLRHRRHPIQHTENDRAPHVIIRFFFILPPTRFAL